MSKHSLLFLLLVAGMIRLAVPAAAQENYYNSSQQEENRPPADKNPETRKDAAAVKTPAAEQESAPVNSFTVTSIQKCYAQLSHEDALEIQQNYSKPYDECQRRLALKLKNEQEKKPGSADGPVKKPSKFYSLFQRKENSEKDTDKEESKKRSFYQEQVPLN
ncbi:MAG: hypothetical protein K8R48_00075 [Alphaproteobacteria bacterium]|nr:hypothetical protein [Alphaproteobacteria bacterium]